MRVFRHFRLHEEDGAAAVYSVPSRRFIISGVRRQAVRLWSTQPSKG